MPTPCVTGGRYRTEGILGQGGVAEVRLARDPLTGRRVALKKALDNDPEAASAIEREFSFAMTCRHPGLVNPLGLFYEDGAPVMVMPLIESSGPASLQGPPESDQERIVAELLETAAFIHFCGFLYNDYKPANFIFRNAESGLSPVLLDFNLVSSLGNSISRRGTIDYAPPEVLEGRTPTPASDIYSLGATIYEFFAGHPPFAAPDSPTLIKLVTEGLPPDFGPLPERFRGGIAALLTRDPASRPQDARLAAEALGVLETFDLLSRSRSGFYLSGGNPPFSAELLRAAREHLNGGSERIFLALEASGHKAELNFLAREFSLEGWRVERLEKGIPEDASLAVLDYLIASHREGEKRLLIIDDLSGLSAEGKHKVRALQRRPQSLPVIASGQRWIAHDLPLCMFDPTSDTTPAAASRETLAAFLKQSGIDLNSEELAEASGGDPELTFLLLDHAAVTGELGLLSPDQSQLSLRPIPEIENVASRMVSPLETREKEILAFLSAWGNELPMILLSELGEREIGAVDSLLATGRLRRGRESLSFPAGLLRQAIYNRVSLDDKERSHAFWAEAAEKHLADNEMFLDIAAWQWGRSNDRIKGFEANLAAARVYFRKSELARAKTFAETLIVLAEAGGGPLATALMLNADILKQEGDYPPARARYLELLRHLGQGGDPALKAETFKDLGDLYRSLKNPRKALNYTRRALEFFQKLENRQGVANCHNNIGLILWVTQEHEKALSSFSAAAEINEALCNFQELAKIQSNIGIIKDILGRTSEVAAHFERAFEDARRAADPWLEALIANNLGYFFIRQNELGRARGYLESALETSQRIGYTESTINALSNLGLLSLRAGELFPSIDYSQRAMQMAESIGNKHLALDAQMYLAEVSIIMGNFALADGVLEGIESDKIYSENGAMAGLVDLRRSWWRRATGDMAGALELARRVSCRAESVGDSRLRLEAELAILEALDGEGNSHGLAAISAEALKLGHVDLADAAELALAKALLSRADPRGLQERLEAVLARPGQSRVVATGARQLLGLVRAFRGRYDEAINLLAEAETLAAGSGFVPCALESAVELGEVYFACGKSSRGQEALRRAGAYAQRIIASLPESVPVKRFAETPIMRRLLKAGAVPADMIQVGR